MLTNAHRVLSRNTQITIRQRLEGLTVLSVGITFTIVLLAGLTAFSAPGFVRDAPNSAADAITRQVPQPATQLLDQTAAQSTPGEVELVTLRPSGFDPAEFSRPSGRFLFGINNRTSFSDLTFQVIDGSGAVVAEHRMARLRVWRKVINPPPGRYLVRVVGHSEWRCAITILP